MADTPAIPPAITNPLYGIETGSIIYAEPFGFAATVLLPGMTAFDKGQSTSLLMTGNSNYLYTDHMNQGSLGLSGSYGVSGVSKFSAAVSGYVGNTESENSDSLGITLNCVKAAGIEYINFNRLTAGSLMRGLMENVRADIKDALDKFVDMSKHPDDEAKKQAWIDAVASFTTRNGTGIVVGTLWGGWGAVKLDFSKIDQDTKWVYGGSAQFKYAGTGASVAVAATYGGSTHTIGEHVNVTVGAYANGRCVEDLVTTWYDELKDLGVDALGKTKTSSPKLTMQGIDPPELPEFVERKEDPSVAGKIGEINNLDGLEAYAKATAYDNYKNNGGKLEMHDWMKSTEEKNDASKTIPTNPEKTVVEEPTVAPSSGGKNSIELMDNVMDIAKPQPTPQPKIKPGVLANYEPMGVWIANWSQLFPWLVSGHSNEVPKSSQAADMIKLRVLHQDFLTLAKLYYRFSSNPNSNLDRDIRFRVPMMSGISLGAIANAFSGGAANISAFLATAGTSGGKSDVRKQIDLQLQTLDPASRKIYATWDKLGLLRGAELGLGITLELGPPGAKDVEKLSFKKFGLGSGTDDKGNMSPAQTDVQLQTPVLEPCNFVGKNFSIFSDFIKGWPLIYVDPHSQETRIVCYVEGPFAQNCGILAQDPDPRFGGGNRNFYIWHGIPDVLAADSRCPVTFVSTADWSAHDDRPDHLWSGFETGRVTGSVHLWPIPFEAANGLINPWKGESMSTGIGDLKTKLMGVVETLGQMKRWSFDSSYWEGKSAKFLKGAGYSCPTIGPSYIGLMSEPTSVFGPGK